MMSSNDSRRILLKSIAAGSGAVFLGKVLPEHWAKPVVDSIILPAHARTSENQGSTPSHYRSDIELIPDELPIGEGQTASLLSLFIEDAYAGRGPIYNADLSIHSPEGTTFTAKMLVTVEQDAYVFRTASGTINGGPTSLVDSGCGFLDGSIEVTSISSAGAVYSLVVGGGTSTGILPLGTGDPTDPQSCPLRA